MIVALVTMVCADDGGDDGGEACVNDDSTLMHMVIHAQAGMMICEYQVHWVRCYMMIDFTASEQCCACQGDRDS